MGIRERIKMYIDIKGISRYRFYQDIGVSNGFLDKEGSIGSEKCEKIYYQYPDINIEWLLTGKGEMLKDTAHINGDKNIVGKNIVGNNNKSVGDVKIGNNSSFNQHDMEHLVEMVKDKDYIIAKLRKQIEEQYTNLVGKLDEKEKYYKDVLNEKERIIEEKDITKGEMLKQIDKYREQVETSNIKIQSLYEKIIELTNNANR